MFAGGVDYEAGPYNATFAVGQKYTFLNITIMNDNKWEDHEKFSVTINIVNGPTCVVKIIDDDGNLLACLHTYMQVIKF